MVPNLFARVVAVKLLYPSQLLCLIIQFAYQGGFIFHEQRVVPS